MANFSKWLGAGLGWTFAGPIGGILGFVVGSFVDGFSETELMDFKNNSNEKKSTQSGDFEISLLVLAAIVIKADGNVDKRELDFVRSSFVSMYGTERANHAFKLFKGIIQNNKISTRQVCLQINRHMNHAGKITTLAFFVWSG